MRSGGGPGWRASAGALLAALAIGCDIPTEAPVIESRWFVPVDGDTIPVADLLPADVTVQDGLFRINVAPVTASRTLGQLCAACVPAEGTTIPKPAFTGVVTATVPLPATVASAVTGPGGLVSIRLEHNLTFDPLRPGATARGQVTIAIRAGTVVLGTLTIDGATTAFPAGTPLVRTVPLAAGVTVTGAATVEATIASPAGDPALILNARSVSMTATPQPVTATEANVQVRDEPVSTGPNALDVSGVSDDIVSRATGAVAEAVLANPLAVGGPVTIRFQQGGTDLIAPKQVQVSGGDETVAVTLTQDETRTLLTAGSVALSSSGTFSGTGGGNVTRVTPTDQVEVRPRLVLTLRFGE